MKIGPPADKTAAPAAPAARPESTAPIKAGPQKPGAAGSAAASNAPASSAAAAANAAATTKAGNNVESSSNVQLSRTAANLISAQKSVNADIDAEKVSRISQQIADNTYQVNAAAIADKLIANAQELLGKVPQ